MRGKKQTKTYIGEDKRRRVSGGVGRVQAGVCTELKRLLGGSLLRLSIKQRGRGTKRGFSSLPLPSLFPPTTLRIGGRFCLPNISPSCAPYPLFTNLLCNISIKDVVEVEDVLCWERVLVFLDADFIRFWQRIRKVAALASFRWAETNKNLQVRSPWPSIEFAVICHKALGAARGRHGGSRERRRSGVGVSES